MAEREVLYCTSADGTRIAYTIEGHGPGVPTIFAAAPPFSNVRDPSTTTSPPEQLKRETCVFDFRGSGLSDRNVQDMTIEAFSSDVEAIVEALGWQRFSLQGMGMSGPVTALYTVRHPDRVTRLVLRDTYLRASDMGRIPRMRALGAVLRTDWEGYLDLMALTVGGWDELDETRSLRERLSRLTTQAETLAIAQASASHDATAIAGDIRVPTLVVNPDYMQVPSADMARAMVSRIPGAKLRLYGRGETPGQVSPWSERQSRVYAYIEEFLGAGDGPRMSDATDNGVPGASTFRTVLFTDLVGHTQMMQRLGDERGRDVLREHERITREVLKANGGTELKTMGDGFMASFGSVTKAVECAVALQRAFSERDGEPLRVRVGLNAGEPIEEDGDLFGATVILASRIAAKAEGGEILVADTVRGLCSGKGFLFADRGEFVAKGIEEPVRISEVHWRR